MPANTTEIIELKLETDWDKVLNSNLTQYTHFVTKVGDEARSIEKAFTKTAKSIAANMSSMFGSVSKEVNISLNQGRNLMRQIMSQGNRVNEYYLKTFDKLNNAQKEFQANLAKTKKDLQARAKLEVGMGKSTPEQAKLKYQGLLDDAKKELKGNLDQQIKLINDNFAKRLGSIARRTSQDIVKLTETNLAAVRGTAKGALAEFEKLKKRLSGTTEASKLFDFQKQFDQMKTQHANLQKQLRDQAKLTSDAEKQMLLAKEAFHRSETEKTRKANKAAFRETLANLGLAKKAYADLEKETNQYSRQVEKAKAETIAMAKAMQKSVAARSRPTNINRLNIDKGMKDAVDRLIDQAKLAGQGMSDALLKSIKQTKTFEQAIERDTARLKELRNEAVILQKTGFVDTRKEIANIDAVLAKYKSFFTEYKQQQKIIDDLSKRSVKTTGIGDLRKIKGAYQEVLSEVRKFGKINEDNYLEANQKLKQLNTLWDRYVSKRKEVYNRVKAIQSEMHDVELMMRKSTNAKLTAELESYYKKLKSKMDNVKKEVAKVSKPPAEIKTVFDQIAKEARDSQRRIQSYFVNTASYATKQFQQINDQFKSINYEAQKLEKKRFINPQTLDDAKKRLETINQSFGKYKDRLEDIKKKYKELEALQRKGLATTGIQKQIKQLRDLEAQVKKNIGTIRDSAIQAQKSVNQLQNKSTKGMLRSSWEAVRNFRWQIAAVIYLISRAVMTVQNTVLRVLKDIQKFRMDAMSLAASFSMQMIGNIGDTYSRAYAFARDLMVKLEIAAAKTILTLEDMLMLTKTFAQAGILAKTDEDVDNIATIGTAIKALTEGMANAGVQMRQELYAILAGRQRATDQLAMMFKFIGVNIQDVIDKAKDSGVSITKALADALEPFNEMNRRMENEFSAVVNRLKVIWGIMERIGSEHILVDTAERLRKLADSLAVVTEGSGIQLTKLGKEVSMILAMSLESVKTLTLMMIDLGKYFVTFFGGWSETFLDTWGLMSGKAKELSGTTRAIAAIFETMMYSVAFIRTYIIAITNLTNFWWKQLGLITGMIKGMGKVFLGILTANKDMIKSGLGNMKDAVLNAWDAGKKVLGTTKEIKEMWADTKKQIDGVYKALDGIKEKNVKLGELFTSSIPIGEITKDVQRFQKKIDELEVAGLSGTQKIMRQYEADVSKARETSALIRKGIEETENNLKRLGAAIGKAGDEGVGGLGKIMSERLQLLKDQLETVNTYIDAAGKKRDEALRKEREKQSKQMAEMARQATVFMNELLITPETRDDKVNKWFNNMVARLDELQVKNKFVAKNIALYWDMLYRAQAEKAQLAFEKTANEYNALMNQISSKDAVNVYEKINENLDKIQLKIEANTNFTATDVKNLEAALKAARSRLISEQKLNDYLSVRSKAYDHISAKAKLMAMSYSPIKRQEAEILELRIATEKSLNDIVATMIKINREFKDEHGNWTKNSEAAQAHFDLLKKEYVLTQEVFEKEFWAKQNPLWNDLNELSKSWADGLSDSLTDLVLDFENFGESIKSLWETILRDTVKAGISRKLIEPMMDKLGGFGDAENPTKLEQWFGATASKGTEGVTKSLKDRMKDMSELDKLIATGQPLPVRIVEDIMEELGVSVDQTTQAVKETNQSVKAGTQATTNSIQQLMHIMNSGANGNFGDAAGGIFSILGSMGGSGGLSGGMNTGPPIHLGAGGTTAFGMADGGTISEHIVGKGLKSGQIYEFGENSKYGEYEDVVPRSKTRKTETNNNVHFSMPISLNALDTRTGVEFITKNQKVIENNMMRSMKNNKAIKRIMVNGR